MFVYRKFSDSNTEQCEGEMELIIRGFHSICDARVSICQFHGLNVLWIEEDSCILTKFAAQKRNIALCRRDEEK